MNGAVLPVRQLLLSIRSKYVVIIYAMLRGLHTCNDRGMRRIGNRGKHAVYPFGVSTVFHQREEDRCLPFFMKIKIRTEAVDGDKDDVLCGLCHDLSCYQEQG